MPRRRNRFGRYNVSGRVFDVVSKGLFPCSGPSDVIMCVYIYIYMYIIFSCLHVSSLLFSSILLQVEKAKFVYSHLVNEVCNSGQRIPPMAEEYPPWVKYKECRVDVWVKSCAGDEASGSNDMPSALHDSQDAQISVHTIGGTIFCVNVSLEKHFLFDVILAIADLNVLEGIEFDQMRLTLEGRKLNEKSCHALSTYGVRHGCELGLVVIQSRCDKCMNSQENESHDIGMCESCANYINDMG